MNTSPKVRQSTYYLSSALLYILGLVQVWFSVKTGGDISSIITGLGTLIGGAAPGYAGYKTGKQINAGVFDEVPVVDQIANGIQTVIKTQVDATQIKAAADADVEAVKKTVTEPFRVSCRLHG
jgi:hypothetical protein